MAFSEAEKKLSGGVAVITGAGSGIGSGFARRAGELGMTVIVTDVSLARAESVAISIRAAGGTAEALQLDVSNPHEIQQLANAIFAKHGHVRLLINNAGIETLGFAWEVPKSRWDATIDINIKGVVHGVRAFLPRMLQSGAECWVANLASIGAFSVMPTQTAYIMTKHAIQSFSEGLFLEMKIKQAPIHVCSVCPGMLRTSIFDEEAGSGEGDEAYAYRKRMQDLMREQGMDLDEGCRLMMAQIADGRFWVISQPSMMADAIGLRVEFLKEQRDPDIAEGGKHLLG
ncbi:hypothetical protein ASPVEDRAFT_129255 [Aspergillus versicolor CBS 583.65]|uniref:Uncharacterized protein n=1 Tax=Aspergillus versicolor CBS 583.65 TaxID=1036611 RepID=A0A1L9PJR2_ASPVE|nr:uncharacterized protein ASPVEDRAFT_129255 [Aspergillus versicolor CBS 583.65]OJJ01764.1 hypothetical protein ASPVEDRAFT_129255 [Aspergillus versicolor CBS 583.65]